MTTSHSFVVRAPDASSDLKMPFLAAALNPAAAEAELSRCLSDFVREQGRFQVKGIHVARYKPARRCLIEYELEFRGGRRAVVLGKARAKGLDARSYEVQRSLYEAGFHEESDDGISVPRLIGLVPRFKMWFQHQVPGVPATSLLTNASGASLAQRIAEALYKLHRSHVPTTRRHTTGDELRILCERLDTAAKSLPHCADRIRRIMDACQRLGTRLRTSDECGIHRDFYPDQIVVDGGRMYLVDMDLYCRGNASLDVGNFVAHLAELSLRESGVSQELADCERAFTERYVKLAVRPMTSDIAAFTTLALARHIYLSTQFPDRRCTTERLLQACELHLGLDKRCAN